MFGLKKLFGGSTQKPVATKPDERTVIPAASMAYLRREAIFDRKNRPAGHIFFLQHESPLANAPTSEQQTLDDMLLATLLSSTEPHIFMANSYTKVA